jgi:hypothetical protein
VRSKAACAASGCPSRRNIVPRAAMHQVTGVQVRRDRVKSGQRSGGTLDLDDGDGQIECNHGRGHDREELIV